MSNKCDCCGYRTVGEDDYEICPVCFWEQDYHNELDEPSGANNGLTIRQGRANYLKYGACEERFIKNVRQPFDNEK